MAYYVTVQNVKDYMGSQSGSDPGWYDQLTDRVGGATAVDAVASEAIEQAEACVDSYLAGKYQVPIDTTNTRVAALLRGLTLKLVVFNLAVTCPNMGDVLDRIEKMHDDAMSYLKGVAKGTITIPALTPLAAPTADGPAAIVGGSPRIFDDCNRSAF